MSTAIGTDIIRKEAWSKVCGAAKYTDDFISPGTLTAKLLTSPYAHAKIIRIDTENARRSPGVVAVVTGFDIDILCGSIIEDQPPLAKGKARCFGEPVALVVARDEQEAKAAVSQIQAEYEPLPVVNSIADALKQNPVIIHENLMQYKKSVVDVYPEANSNVCDRIKIRKGDTIKGFNESDTIISGDFSLPQSDHAAMEVRCARCEIMPDGQVIISSCTQAPYSVKKQISEYFRVPEGNITVKVPLVGGGFGGKVPVQLEVLAYIASKAAGGRAVKIVNSREEDMVTSPCGLGLCASIKLGAKWDGKITAAEMTFNVDCGAYSEIGPRLAKAIAVDCAGPYNIENISCDSLCVYTNHPYVSPYRSFGHVSHAFCLERMMDKLARALNIDAVEIRMKNAVKEGDCTPTQTKVTLSNTGNFGECLTRAKALIKWDEGNRIEENGDFVRAKGIGCLCKTSDPPTDAVSSAIITFNTDGSINLNCGAVECGPAMRTTAAQILAEKFKIDVSDIYVKMDVDTSLCPKHWKTVASMTTFMLGSAVISAADDVIRQLLGIGGIVLRCPPEQLEVGGGRVYSKADPDLYVAVKDLAHGYQYPNGNAVGGQIIGRGSFIMNHLTFLDPETGKGKAGPGWTVGAQAVEVLYDKKQHTYRIIKTATVIDAGKVINPKTARGLVMGGVCMGIGLAADEAFVYDDDGIVRNTSFRTYKMVRFGEEPEYLVDFIETPQTDAPFGARGFGEHGIIGIPAAVANALSKAACVEIDSLPITPESIWRKAQENKV